VYCLTWNTPLCDSEKEDMQAMRTYKVIRCVVFAAFIAALGSTGCSKPPNKENQSKLEEAKAAAESAEKKLSEVKQERMRLETERGQKKDEEK
jgi:hypothetical protein